MWYLVHHSLNNQYMHMPLFIPFLLQSTCDGFMMMRWTQVRHFPTKAPLTVTVMVPFTKPTGLLHDCHHKPHTSSERMPQIKVGAISHRAWPHHMCYIVGVHPKIFHFFFSTLVVRHSEGCLSLTGCFTGHLHKQGT